MSRDDAERVLGSVQEPASSLIKTSIRPPLALHRTGKARSTLLVPEDPEEAARRLAIDSPVRPIKHRARWGAFEAAQAEDPDASSAICAVARGGANAGWSFEDFMTVISSPATPVSTLLASRISREGWRRSRSWARKAVWDDAVDLIKEHPPTGEPDAEVIAQLGWALDRQWAGATGRSDFVVYLALLRKQAMCGRTEFDLSVREIAEFAGLGSINTVRSSLARLVGAGLVARIAEGSRGLVTRRSATWRLTPQEASLDLTPAGFAEVMAAISHEVFWNKIALNKGSAMLYVQLLVRGMLTTADLVDLTGWSPRVTRERLADMAHSGVVVEVGEEWSATTLFELDIAAKDFGVDGRGAAQRQAHDRQRIGSDIRSG